MIRIATFEEVDPKLMKDLCRLLYTAFAVGCESVGQVAVPAGLKDPFDANALLDAAPRVQSYPDDKVLYLTSRRLSPRKLPSAEVPTYGVSRYGAQRALISTAHIKNAADNAKAVARFAMHEVGHTWNVHHCIDARCAMYPHWTPSYLLAEATFCVFCREQSDAKVSLAKS